MAESSTRRIRRLYEDRISELPRNLQEAILGYPNMQTEASNVVKVLDGFYKVKRFSIAMYFLKADGNLMKEVDEENLKSYCIDDSEDCTIDHLEIVTFAGFEGQRPELELVRFLLGHSPLLKIMSIDCSEDIERDDELTMAKEMLQYSRASSRAQIRRINHPNMYKEFEFNLWKTDEMYV
ncbi:hypothetical protein AgCh_035084 [Apium graveolens]